MEPLISVQGAGVSLGGRPVLRDIDLTIAVGDVVGISGPNGSGKTTLMRMLASLARPDRGTGHVLGADIRSDEVYSIRRAISYIGHVPSVIGELSLRENLTHAARLVGIGEERIDRVLEVVGLAEAAAAKSASASFGTQRRLEVGRALLGNPRMLLLDEAFSGLDSDAQSLIDALASRTTSGGGCVVMVSHDVDHLRERSRSEYRLSGGRLGEVR